MAILSSTEYAKAVSSKCKKCADANKAMPGVCPDNWCPLRKVTNLPAQLDLFTEGYKPAWLADALKEVKSMHSPFWFSDFRKNFNKAPAHKNWWGGLTKAMKASGCRMTGRTRCSPTPSVKGGLERQWTWDKQYIEKWLVS